MASRGKETGRNDEVTGRKGMEGSSGSLRERIRQIASVIGPGIFLMGYIIGTGSVTAMVNAGASYGMSMMWALALSCLFTYVMVVSISRCTIVSGETILHLITMRFGRVVSTFLLIGLMLTVVTSVIGITAIASDIFREWSRFFMPSGDGIHTVISTAGFIGLLYYLFWYGKHGFFMKAMAVVAGIMAISFISSMMLVIPSLEDIVQGMVPGLPSDGVASLALAGLVGTTMASVVIVSRSYLVAEKGWKLKDLKSENRDAILSLVLTFIVSAAIMASAAGTLFVRGIPVRDAIDMVGILQPLAGDFAATLFTLGIIAAALSSLFASYLLGPWMVCDYLNVPRRMDHPYVRAGVLLLAISGFIVPVFGGSPVLLMIASQAISPVIMPLLVILIFVLLNSEKAMGSEYRNPMLLNIGLVVTFIFTLFMSWAGIVGLLDFIAAM